MLDQDVEEKEKLNYTTIHTLRHITQTSYLSMYDTPKCYKLYELMW